MKRQIKKAYYKSINTSIDTRNLDNRSMFSEKIFKKIFFSKLLIINNFIKWNYNTIIIK